MTDTNPRTNGARALGNGHTAHDVGGSALNRAAPHNLEAEQALLGAILVNNDAHERVSFFLEPHHFYDPLHQQIYETAAQLIATGKQATPITLKTFFQNAEPIDATLTVPQYLGRLAANAATIINARDYGRTIYDLATRRQLILIGEDMVNAAYDSPVDFPPKEQIEEAETRLFALVQHGSHERGSQPAYVFVEQAIVEIDTAHKRGGGPAGHPTYLSPIDDIMGGMVDGNLIVVAGRASMGKSAIAANIAINNARHGTPTLVHTLEMSGRELMLRHLSRCANVAVSELRRGRMADPNAIMRRVLEANADVKNWPLYVDESGGLTIAQIAAKIRRACRKLGIRLVVIDYLQLLNGNGYRGRNRTQEITEITTGLKALAKELNVPIVALSQLSRAVENRENKRPQLSDLRESGSIEQDADVVMFVYRDAYYLERERPDPANAEAYETWRAQLDAAHGKAEVIIAKQRQGQTGIVELAFDGATTTFYTLPDGRRT